MQRPIELAKRARRAAIERRLDLRDDRQRNLLRRLTAEVEADGAVNARISGSSQQLFAARFRA